MKRKAWRYKLRFHTKQFKTVRIYWGYVQYEYRSERRVSQVDARFFQHKAFENPHSAAWCLAGEPDSFVLVEYCEVSVGKEGLFLELHAVVAE